jgi:serine/threonine protein kinase
LSKGEEADKNKTKYDTKCEVYSFGILLWEIAECKIPYEGLEGIEEITKEVAKGHRKEFTKCACIPEKYQDLVNKAVDQNPGHRPTFAKMLVDLQDIFKEYIPSGFKLLWLKNAIRENLIAWIKWNELTEFSEVGSGCYGSIIKAHWSKTNDYVAFKKLNNSQENTYHEIKMQSRAHGCENIIRFIGITKGTYDKYFFFYTKIKINNIIFI